MNSMRLRACVLLCFFSAALGFGQTDNTVYVRQFPGATVGLKMSAAMAACNPNTAIPCIVVLDPTLAVYASGTMPTLCAQCSLLDYRAGVPSYGKAVPGVTLGTFSTPVQPLQQSIDGSGNVLLTGGLASVLEIMRPSGQVLHTFKMPYPTDCAVSDAAGFIWVCHQSDGKVSRVNPTTGAVVGTYATGAGPDSIAVDQRGYVWVTDSGSPDSVTVLTNLGKLVGTYSTGSGAPWNVVFDASGNAWTDNWPTGTVSKISPNGTLLGVFRVGTNPQVLAIDKAGFVWVPNQGDGTVTKLSSVGATLFNVSLAAAGVPAPGGLAIDGGGNVWVFGSDSSVDKVVELNSTGQILGTYTIGKTGAYACVDGSGNLWITNAVDSTITKMTTGAPGIITPVVANLDPLSSASSSHSDKFPERAFLLGAIFGVLVGSVVGFALALSVLPGWKWTIRGLKVCSNSQQFDLAPAKRIP